MGQEQSSGRSLRIKRLTDKFRNKRYRDAYVDANVRRFLAQQMRSLRGTMSQEEFGRVLGKPQSVVSRFEDPAYGKFTLQTLLEIAASLDRAVVARIVDFPTFLRLTEDLSEEAMSPVAYDSNDLDRFALGLLADGRNQGGGQQTETTVSASKGSSVLDAPTHGEEFNQLEDDTLIARVVSLQRESLRREPRSRSRDDRSPSQKAEGAKSPRSLELCN